MNHSFTEIPIMHCFDNNYVIPAAVSFQTMLKHADPKYRYRLFVLHSDITVQNQEKLTELVHEFPNAEIEFMNMAHRFDDMPGRGHLTKEVLYKLLVASIFPQYDRLLITDVDVLFKGDIAPSYFVFDENPDACFAGVRHVNLPGTFLRKYYIDNYTDPMEGKEAGQLKICGGYLVANLDAIRKQHMEEVMVAYLTKHVGNLPQLEQDVINFCFRDKQIVYLPLNYVVCSYLYDFEDDIALLASDPHYTYGEIIDAMEHPIQLHYATGVKPWLSHETVKADLWLEAIENTEFSEDYRNWYRVKKQEGTDIFPGEKVLHALQSPAPKATVSVVCCCYNHEKFMNDTLRGILEQKGDFELEVIVADDCSTDGTQAIIREFMAKYPEQMKKTILREKNVGIGLNYYEALSAAEGEFLALCDGDDFWADPYKLQKQLAFMRAHPEYTLVCSDFVSHYADQPEKEDVRFSVSEYYGEVREKYTVKDLIDCRFIASCTTMYRWKLRGNVPAFIKHYNIIDFPLNLIHASAGYIGVIHEPLAKYNVHGNSISNQAQMQLQKEQLTVMYEVNQFLEFGLTNLIAEYRSKLQGTEVASAMGFKRRCLRFVYKIYDKVCPKVLHRVVIKLMPKRLYDAIQTRLH